MLCIIHLNDTTVGEKDSGNYTDLQTGFEKSQLKQQIDYVSRKGQTSTQKHLLEVQN